MTNNTLNYRDAFNLEGKVALVSGGAGDLGAEICRGLAAVGASLPVLSTWLLMPASMLLAQN